jgi:hypothetical protein
LMDPSPGGHVQSTEGVSEEIVHLCAGFSLYVDVVL